MKIDEFDACDKILRTLPKRCSEKVSTIETSIDSDNLTRNSLLGMLTNFEIRTKDPIP